MSPRRRPTWKGWLKISPAWFVNCALAIVLLQLVVVLLGDDAVLDRVARFADVAYRIIEAAP